MKKGKNEMKKTNGKDWRTRKGLFIETTDGVPQIDCHDDMTVRTGLRIGSSPTYSTDLAPGHFFLLANFKPWIGAKKFSSNEIVVLKGLTISNFEFRISNLISEFRTQGHRADA